MRHTPRAGAARAALKDESARPVAVKCGKVRNDYRVKTDSMARCKAPAWIGVVLRDGSFSHLGAVADQQKKEFYLHPDGPCNRWEIMRTWGSSEVLVSGLGWGPIVLELRDLLCSRMHVWVYVHVSAWRRHHLTKGELDDAVRKLMRGGYDTVQSVAREFQTIELWRMWGRAGRLKLESERKKVRAQISAALRKKGLVLHPGKPLVIPCPSGASAAAVRRSARRCLAQVGIHHKIRRSVRIQIGRAKAQTAASILMNHKRFVAELQPDKRLA